MNTLQQQALRLPQRARDRLAGLAHRLGASGAPVKVAEAARGICLLALELARGAAGGSAANAACIAASDPVQRSVRNALGAFITLLDTEPVTTPMERDRERGEERARAGAALHHLPTPERRDLHTQALRLPEQARSDLAALAAALRAAGASVTAAEAMRGLCLLALEIADGAAGPELSEAFEIAARDSTASGMCRALDAVRQLLDGVPSTTPEPPPPTPPTWRPGDSSPPTKRAA